MNWSIALVAAGVVGVLGLVIARLWWNLAHKAAPYSDDAEIRSNRRERDDAVVIKDE